MGTCFQPYACSVCVFLVTGKRCSFGGHARVKSEAVMSLAP